jgi:hypothetical protein
MESNLADPYRLVSVYTGRILNGEKPANLPPKLNSLSTSGPRRHSASQLLGRADEVIE